LTSKYRRGSGRVVELAKSSLYLIRLELTQNLYFNHMISQEEMI